mgnify:FL=1
MAEETKPDVQNTPEPKTDPQPKTYSEAEYNALKSQLDSLKQSAKDNEDFKEKFEQSEQARKDFEHKTKVSAFVKSLGLKDDIYEKHVENLILEKGLKFENDKLIGGDDVVSSFREAHADAFRPNMTDGVSAPTSGNAPPVMDGVTKAFLARNPDIRI